MCAYGHPVSARGALVADHGAEVLCIAAADTGLPNGHDGGFLVRIAWGLWLRLGLGRRARYYLLPGFDWKLVDESRCVMLCGRGWM